MLMVPAGPAMLIIRITNQRKQIDVEITIVLNHELETPSDPQPWNHIGNTMEGSQPRHETYRYIELQMSRTSHRSWFASSQVWLAVQPPLGIPGDPMRLLLLGMQQLHGVIDSQHRI